MHRHIITLLALCLSWPTQLPADWRDETRSIVNEVERIRDGDSSGDAAEKFQALVDLSEDWTMLNYPEFASYRGDPRGRDRWTDNSEAAIAQRQEDERIFLAAVSSIDRASLPDSLKVNYDLLLDQLRRTVEDQQFPEELLPLNQMTGVQQDVAQMMALMQPKDLAAYEDMLSRLESVPEIVDQDIARMRRGMAQGITPPQITLRDVPQQVRNQLVDDPSSSPVLVAFQQIPESIDPLQAERISARAQAAFSERVAPAYEKLLTFLEDEYLPAARESIALGDLPNGKAWYAHNVKVRTTTDLTPEEIHQIGLSEVARIRAEMEQIREETGFEGDLLAFFEYLRTDPRFYHTSADDLLREYRDIAKRADPELMKVFGRLPRTPYGVIAVPSYAEKSQTTAYYQRGSVQAGRPGYFYANTYALDTRPRWEMEALTLHEAVPGHHLQLALQDELEDVPWFRRLGGQTAFVEGWGLYSESLGVEMGFYKDPYSKFGQLTYEMWRAIRLVVDTGMHQLGWTRQQAIDYFKENAGKQEHDIIVEIDRYIVWPGQALAYKIGELKIKELRAWATAELGDQFDVRAFHDTVLGSGAVPLDMLEANVRAWVASVKS